MRVSLKTFLKQNFNVPNTLTAIRMLLIPVYVVLFGNGQRYPALGVFLAASLTDLLDGMIARCYHQITNLGKLMDPLADKLMVLTVLFSMAIGNRSRGDTVDGGLHCAWKRNAAGCGRAFNAPSAHCGVFGLDRQGGAYSFYHGAYGYVFPRLVRASVRRLGYDARLDFVVGGRSLHAGRAGSIRNGFGA